MSIPSTAPSIWANSQLITPERLNRNLLAARTEMEAFARNRWHRWTVSTDVVDENDVLLDLPVIQGVVYYVERITVYGTYTGAPVLSWGSSVTPDTYTLPLDGVAPQHTVLPGEAVGGGITTDWLGKYQIKLTGATGTNMRALVGLRIARVNEAPPIVDATDLATWSQGEVLSATKFAAQRSALDAFATAWSTGAAIFPTGMHYTEFRVFNNTISTPGTTTRFQGSGPDKTSKILCRVTLTSAGAVGQTVTVSAGYGSLATIMTVSIAGLTDLEFTSGIISLTDSVRNPLTAADDFQLRITTNGTSVVKRAQIYCVHGRF